MKDCVIKPVQPRESDGWDWVREGRRDAERHASLEHPPGCLCGCRYSPGDEQ